MNFVWFSAQCVLALFADDAHVESSEIITRAFASVRKILFCTKAPKIDRFRKINMENEIFFLSFFLPTALCFILLFRLIICVLLDAERKMRTHKTQKASASLTLLSFPPFRK